MGVAGGSRGDDSHCSLQEPQRSSGQDAPGMGREEVSAPMGREEQVQKR